MVSEVGIITVALPEKVLEALEKRAKSEGKAVEELISEAILKQLNTVNPKAKAELHLNARATAPKIHHLRSKRK